MYLNRKHVARTDCLRSSHHWLGRGVTGTHKMFLCFVMKKPSTLLSYGCVCHSWNSPLLPKKIKKIRVGSVAQTAHVASLLLPPYWQLFFTFLPSLALGSALFRERDGVVLSEGLYVGWAAPRDILASALGHLFPGRSPAWQWIRRYHKTKWGPSQQEESYIITSSIKLWRVGYFNRDLMGHSVSIFNLNSGQEIYVCVCILLYVYVYTYIYTYMYVYIHIHTYTYICVCILMCVYIYIIYIYFKAHPFLSPTPSLLD